ncbi:TAXI family TRAP transporter solute-binding subunit [Pseudorhodobacter turbinis]|nr:TAXI family TRAP transporter solute-binding subunit [Pseudorhodobacter turbinis]
MTFNRTLIVAIGALLPASIAAADVTLPEQMTWASYDSQSIVYAESISIGKVLEKHYGMKLQVVPIRNGFSRFLPVLSGKADLMTTGSDGYFAQEGAFIFAKKGFGPQPLRIIAYNANNPGNGAAVTADSGVKTWADAKGKRVAVVQGSAAPAKVVEASLAFAGLTWEDVIRVPVSSWSAGQEALINGQADIAAANTTSPSVERLANSPRGIFWPPTAHDDTEGWARLNAVAPYIQRAEICQGIGIPDGTCVQINGYGYPEYLSLPDLADDTVYNLVKAMDINSDEIGTAFPRAKGYAFDLQVTEQAWPWHEGVIRYFKEKGVWNDEAQAHQDGLIMRQEVLAAAWAEMNAGDVPDDEVDFAAKWGEVRAQHLSEAGLPVVYKDVWNF